MAQPEYKATQSTLQRGIEVTDSIIISFWFNIKDPDLMARLDAYYTANEDDYQQQPGLELQVKIGDQYHRICRSRLFLNDGAPRQAAPAPTPTPAPAPTPTPAPAPIPVVSTDPFDPEPPFDPAPRPVGYGNNG